MPKLKQYKRWGDKYQDNRNWKIYNKQLVRRGELYISMDFLEEWDQELQKMNSEKLGRRYLYPEKFIKWTALVYQAMNMPYRILEGFLKRLSRYVPKLKAADYTTLFRRIRDLNIDLADYIPEVNRPIVISVDTTGIHLTTRGEWIRYKWRVYKEQRGWIKIHMAVDTRRKDILALNITDEKMGDDTGFKYLMNQCIQNIGERKISRLLADGAYDRVKIFNYLVRYRIKSGIKMRKDANPFDFKGSRYRLMCVYRRNMIGHTGWKKEVGYSMRWASESVFSSVKRMFGEYVKATSKEGALREAYRKFVIYNVLANYGRGKVSGF